MKYYLKLGVILMAICAIATGILAYVNSVTEPKIEALKAEEAVKSREELIPDCDFEEVSLRDDFSYFIATDKETKELKGYTFTSQKKGYGSTIKTMAGLDPEFRVIGIKIIDQSETPGLGANCTKESFTSQFAGKTPEQLVVDKDGGPIKSLSGATITSRAIASSLKEEIEAIKADLDKKQQQEVTQ